MKLIFSRPQTLLLMLGPTLLFAAAILFVLLGKPGAPAPGATPTPRPVRTATATVGHLSLNTYLPPHRQVIQLR